MQRRQFIQLAAASSLAATTTANSSELPLTVKQVEGPFYPVQPIPDSNNLLLSPQHHGTELLLSGRVLNRSGKPQANARVEIWQCDGRGIYQHPSGPGHTSFDKHFRGFGATTTDNNGKYQFVTIVPVPYTGRPPHIHTKVFTDNKEQLTSQIYLRDNRGHDQLKIDLVKISNAIFTANFDFVI